MSDLITRHRAAADALRHQPGNAAAAQCKFHSETADEIERLERIEIKYNNLCNVLNEQVEEIERLKTCIQEQHDEREAHSGVLAQEIEHLRERDTDFQRRLKGQEREIERLQSELDHYKNGYQGSCYACEPVGKENEHLQKLYDVAVADRVRMHEETKHLRSALEHRSAMLKETSDIEERLRSALERIAEYEDGGALAFIQIQRIVDEALHTQNGDVDTQSGDDDG